jgi:multiple antibiotic resistance protein
MLRMWKQLALSFIAMFVALDIVGTVPLYTSITRGLSPDKRRHIVDTSMVVALIVALLFMVLGKSIFRFLGIEVFDFKMAGGLILLLISLADLLGGPEAVQKSSGSTGVVPLAVPLITGPAVLTTIILQVDLAGYPITLATLVLNYFIAWVLLRKAGSIERLIGEDGAVVVSKLAALMLAAIGVAMIRTGVLDSIHAFK